MIKTKINSRGFTLIELLAVIVILAVLILLALPNVLKIMENARKNAFETEARSYLKAAELKYTEKSLGTSAGSTMVFSDTGTDNDTCSSASPCKLDVTSKSDYEYYIEASYATGTLTFIYTIQNDKYLAKADTQTTLNAEIAITKKSADSANATVYTIKAIEAAFGYENKVLSTINHTITQSNGLELITESIIPQHYKYDKYSESDCSEVKCFNDNKCYIDVSGDMTSKTCEIYVTPTYYDVKLFMNNNDYNHVSAFGLGSFNNGYYTISIGISQPGSFYVDLDTGYEIDSFTCENAETTTAYDDWGGYDLVLTDIDPGGPGDCSLSLKQK